MAERIPDLWRAKEDARQLYSLYLGKLQMNRRHERVVVACRQIRRYAARGPGIEVGLFTFFSELDALCELGKYKIAWRQLRLREEIIFGERLNLATYQWNNETASELPYLYAPVLYFLGRHDQGCSLLETWLDLWFAWRKRCSFDVMFRVINNDDPPSNRCRVTLSHFYKGLGKDLTEWRHWETFVRGFHAKLFPLAGMRRADLLADPDLLLRFFKKLVRVRNKRTISGVSRGQADLINSPEEVRQWHEAEKKKRREFNKRIKPTKSRTNAKLQDLFPELRELPR